MWTPGIAVPADTEARGPLRGRRSTSEKGPSLGSPKVNAFRVRRIWGPSRNSAPASLPGLGRRGGPNTGDIQVQKAWPQHALLASALNLNLRPHAELTQGDPHVRRTRKTHAPAFPGRLGDRRRHGFRHLGRRRRYGDGRRPDRRRAAAPATPSGPSMSDFPERRSPTCAVASPRPTGRNGKR